MASFFVGALPSLAGAFIIDFEQFAKGTVVTDQMQSEIAPGAGVGVRISANNFFHKKRDFAVVFDTRHPSGGDDDLGGPFDYVSPADTGSDDNRHGEAEDNDHHDNSGHGYNTEHDDKDSHDDNYGDHDGDGDDDHEAGDDSDHGQGSTPRRRRAAGNVLILQEANSRGVKSCFSGRCRNPDDEGRRGARRLDRNRRADAETRAAATDDEYYPTTGAGALRFNFSDNVFLDYLDVFDIEGEEAGNNRIRVYNTASSTVAFQTFDIPTTGDGKAARAMLNVAGVRRLEIVLGGSGAIDNIAGNYNGQQQTSVPEPAPLGLFLLGLLGVRRLRRRQPERPPSTP